jgi:hypothetical protein
LTDEKEMNTKIQSEEKASAGECPGGNKGGMKPASRRFVP